MPPMVGKVGIPASLDNWTKEDTDLTRSTAPSAAAHREHPCS